MFNTLNSLYGLVVGKTGKSDKTEQLFIKFTDILQYMYKHVRADTIALGEEINYIKDYIELQSLRLNRHTHVFWGCETDDEHVEIVPMLLITFVENAFKYGCR